MSVPVVAAVKSDESAKANHVGGTFTRLNESTIENDPGHSDTDHGFSPGTVDGARPEVPPADS